MVWPPRKSKWGNNRTGSWGRRQPCFHSAPKQATLLTKLEAYTSRPLPSTWWGHSSRFHRRNNWRDWPHLPWRRQQANPGNWVQRAAPGRNREEGAVGNLTGRQMCLTKREDGLGNRYMCLEMNFPLPPSWQSYPWRSSSREQEASDCQSPGLSALQTPCGIVKLPILLCSYFLTFRKDSLFHLGRGLGLLHPVLIPPQDSITKSGFWYE